MYSQPPFPKCDEIWEKKMLFVYGQVFTNDQSSDVKINNLEDSPEKNIPRVKELLGF
ncbi:MAG: hypothetical protein ACI8RA_003084 [Chlamydiales bacterium]|jgi:hypothetical protein